MSHQAHLLTRQRVIRTSQRGWQPRPLRFQNITTPKPMEQGEESLQLAAQTLKEASISAGTSALKGASIPTLALLYVLTTTAAGCNEKSSPFWEINPNTECTAYPYGEIYQDIDFTYSPGTAELPGERTTVLDLLGSIDYRFTEGIKKVVIQESENCEFRGGLWGDTLFLYRQTDGQGGAFEDSGWIKWVIHHEIGHLAEIKAGKELYEEFASIFTTVFNENYPNETIDQELIKEDFANCFARYILAGPYFKLLGEIPKEIKSNYILGTYEDVQTDKRIYDWLKKEFFCERDFPTNRIDHYEQRTAEIYFQKGNDYRITLEYEKSIEAYNNAILHNYAGSDQARLNIAFIHHFNFMDKESALPEYEKLINDYPNSPHIPTALYAKGDIYNSLGRYAEAVPPLLRFINEFPGSTNYDWGLYLLGNSYYRENKCLDAVYYLQRLINEYPDFSFNTYAHDFIDDCNNP
jgi:tetratricopeptide (TPR) repeat protein